MPTLADPQQLDKAKVGRRSRYRALTWLREFSVRGGARICMSALPAGTVRVAYHESGRSTVAGTRRCGSMAACPVCAETGRRTRADEIDKVVTASQAAGHHVFFVTATVAHPRAYPLRILQRAVNESWGKAWSGRAMREHGYIGQVKSWDYTYGDNGWHPHIHALVVVDGSTSRSSARAFVESRFDAYKQNLNKRNQTVRRKVKNTNTGQIESVGWDVRDVTPGGKELAVYVGGVVKVRDSVWTAGSEVALSTQKRSSVSPWSILRAVVDGEVPPGSALVGSTVSTLRALWREYEMATKGLKQIVIGRKLLDLAAIDQADDDDAVIGVDDSEVVYCEWFAAAEWDRIAATGRIAATIERIEAHGRSISRAGP